jgi:quinol monooxygenase YgiN
MKSQPTILVNVLKTEPARQAELVALLKQSTETVVRTLPGWRSTRLIAANDGASVVIYSEWETPAAIEAMRGDPRMMDYFPRVAELASLESIMGSATLSETR